MKHLALVRLRPLLLAVATVVISFGGIGKSLAQLPLNSSRMVPAVNLVPGLATAPSFFAPKVIAPPKSPPELMEPPTVVADTSQIVETMAAEQEVEQTKPESTLGVDTTSIVLLFEEPQVQDDAVVKLIADMIAADAAAKVEADALLVAQAYQKQPDSLAPEPEPVADTTTIVVADEKPEPEIQKNDDLAILIAEMVAADSLRKAEEALAVVVDAQEPTIDTAAEAIDEQPEFQPISADALHVLDSIAVAKAPSVDTVVLIAEMVAVDSLCKAEEALAVVAPQPQEQNEAALEAVVADALYVIDSLTAAKAQEPTIDTAAAAIDEQPEFQPISADAQHVLDSIAVAKEPIVEPTIAIDVYSVYETEPIVIQAAPDSTPITQAVRYFERVVEGLNESLATFQFILNRGDVFVAEGLGELSEVNLRGYQSDGFADYPEAGGLNNCVAENQLTISGLAQLNAYSTEPASTITASFSTLPLTAPNGLRLSLTIDGKAYNLKLPYTQNQYRWDGGYIYNYVLTLNAGELEVTGMTVEKK